MSNIDQFIPRLKSVQRGTIILNTGITTNTATVTAVDTTKSVLNHLGASYAATTLADPFVRLILTNSTTITATRQSSASAVTVSYELVEYY